VSNTDKGQVLQASMVNNDELVSIGEICGTYGTGGTVKVRPLTDYVERFDGMTEVLVSQGARLDLYAIESIVAHGQWLLFKFAGIDTREQAQSLRSGILKVAESDLFPLPEDCYYIFQLQVLPVYDEERGLLGTIVDVLQTGANDVYVVNGGRYGEILIPVIKQVVTDIDLEERLVRVKLLPGLIDEEERPRAD